MVSIKNVMVCWTPAHWEKTEIHDAEPGSVKLVRHPDRVHASGPYLMTEGACDSYVDTFKRDRLDLAVFMLFQKLVIRDGLDPQAVHKVFCELEEYQRRLSPDTPGVAPLDGDTSW